MMFQIRAGIPCGIRAERLAVRQVHNKADIVGECYPTANPLFMLEQMRGNP